MAGQAALAAFEKTARDTGARLEIATDTLRAPAEMDRTLMTLVDRTARSCGFEPFAMRSVAGHDAVALQNSGIPAALIFIPSVDGIAHHPDELTHAVDMQAGLTVLTAVLRQLTERHGDGQAG